MFGDTYNFQFFSEQEQIYDISSIDAIYKMELYFYEAIDSFKNKDGNLIPYTENKIQFDGIQNDTEFLLSDNLFTREPYICLGYDLNNFHNNDVILYTLNNTTYKITDKNENDQNNFNKKNINLRWVHSDEKGDPFVLTPQVYKEKYNNDYIIKWYRYQFGAPSADEYSGVYWKEVNQNTKDPFYYSFTPDVNNSKEKIKVIIFHRIKQQDEYIIKEIFKSNILIFTNEQEVINQATIDKLNKLSIQTNDYTNGDYFLYDQNNYLIDQTEQKKIRKLVLYFGDSLLQEATSIKWIFPIKHTMLDNYYIHEKTHGVISDNGIYEEILYEGKEINNGYCLSYGINNVYTVSNVNNTVKCIIKKDHREYEAIINLEFGIMGTNGTDATLDIDFRDSTIRAIYCNPDANKDEIKEVIIIGKILDQSHKEIDLNNDKYNDISFEWSWQYNNSDDLYKIQPYYECKNQCLISYKPSEVSMDTFLILQLSVYGFGDYKLVSYFPIPITAYENYYYIGPDRIVYSSDGYINYSRVPLQCLPLNDTERNDNNNKYQSYEIYNPNEETRNFVGEISRNFRVQENQAETIENLRSFLLPYPFYIDNMNSYGIQCCQYDYVLETAKSYDDKINYYILKQENDQNYYYTINFMNNEVKHFICEEKDKYIEKDKDFEAGIEYYEQTKTYILVKEAIEEDKLNYYELNINTHKYEKCTKDTVFNKDKKYYTESISYYPVYFYTDNFYYKINEETKKIIWTQPICILQNLYPCSTINEWDNKFAIDEELGQILSTRIAAGTKNSDNTFSGVMIGDWKNVASSYSANSTTGIYGYNHGHMSYAFKDDGTAFIGKSGQGRIIFDGNKGVIQSQSWPINKEGMFIDLDDGHIEICQENHLIDINALERKYPLRIGDNINPKFKVKWDGRMEATGGKFSGQSGGYDIIIDAGNSEIPFKIGNYFSVNWDGSLYASNGQFSGCIDSSTITGSTVYTDFIHLRAPSGTDNKHHSQCESAYYDLWEYNETTQKFEKQQENILKPNGDNYIPSEDGKSFYLKNKAIPPGEDIALIGAFYGSVPVKDENDIDNDGDKDEKVEITTNVVGIDSSISNYPIVLKSNTNIGIRSMEKDIWIQSFAENSKCNIHSIGSISLSADAKNKNSNYSNISLTKKGIDITAKDGKTLAIKVSNFTIATKSLVVSGIDGQECEQTGIYARFK